jgi:hypothetical protein
MSHGDDEATSLRTVEHKPNEPVLPSRRHFLGAACAAAAAALAATETVAESPTPSAGSPCSLGSALTAGKLESLELTAIERAFLAPITLIWEHDPGEDAPVTEFHVAARSSRGKP